MPGAIAGDRVILGGEFGTHPKYGEQFRIESFFRDVPDTGYGVHAWLVEHLPDIGPARADALVQEFGAGLWATLEKSGPERLTLIRGITLDRAKAIQDAYALHKSARKAMVEYMDLGLKAAEASTLFEYVKRTDGVDAQYFKANPYCLFLEASCVRLERAIQIGQALGKFPHADWHVCWTIHRVRTHMNLTGATYIDGQKISRWDKYPHGVLVDKAVERALRREWLFELEPGVFQLPRLYRAESSIIHSVTALLEREAVRDRLDGGAAAGSRPLM